MFTDRRDANEYRVTTTSKILLILYGDESYLLEYLSKKDYKNTPQVKRERK